MTTGVTLLVLLGILAIGLVVGARTLFSPLPGSDPTASVSPTCTTTTVKKGQRVFARQVQVSVFNAGTRSGLAGDTLAALARRGFKKGRTGNAPEGSKVKVAQVWTSQRNDTAARLVARQFGAKIKVFLKDGNLGPGVDVVVGDRFDKLAKATKSVVARRASSVCVPTGSPTAG